MTEYLELEDLLVIGEQVFDIPAEDLAKTMNLGLAQSALWAPRQTFEDIEFYPDLIVKAAVLCAHIAKNHALIDGNKRMAFMCMVEFLERNGFEWNPPEGDWDGEVTDAKIRAVAAGRLDDEMIGELAEWIRTCVV